MSRSAVAASPASFGRAGRHELRDRLMQRRYKGFKSRIRRALLMESMASDDTKAIIEFRVDAYQI